MFSEVVLVAVHCNWLIGYIMITRGYRPYDTATTQRIFTCLLKTAIKTLIQNLKFVHFFIYQPFGCPKPTFGLCQGGNLTHPMLITVAFHVRLDGHREPSNEVGSQNLYECISGVWVRNLLILFSVTILFYYSIFEKDFVNFCQINTMVHK